MPPDARSRTRRHQLYLKAAERYRNTPVGTSKRPFRTRALGRWPKARVPGLKAGPATQQQGIYRRPGRPKNLI